MSLSALTLIKGETAPLRFQLTEAGAPKDITGMSFTLGVKLHPEDAAYAIGPLEGSIEDAASGIVSVPNPAASAASAVSGVYELVMFDGVGGRATITPPLGIQIRVAENIVD
jgi:hypothetical protein